MHQTHHEALTRYCARIAGIDQALVARLVSGSSWPDRAYDLYVVHWLLGPGRHFRVLERNLASFTHFGHWALGLVRGYCWPEDPTVRAFNVPNTDVEVDVTDWARTVYGVVDDRSIAWAQKHPHLRLVNSGANTLALDEVVYAHHASMAGWLEEPAADFRRRRDLERLAFVVGCQLHMLQDAAVQPHDMRRLLGGHVEYETASYSDFLRRQALPGLPYLPAVRRWPGFRLAVERAARAGVHAHLPSGANDVGVRWTLAALRAFPST